MAPLRSIIYVDGFNLYHGCLKGTRDKWLNLQEYFERLREKDQIEQIYYFTAKMAGDHYIRQSVYLRALATLPKVTIVEGKYKTKRAPCRVNACTHAGVRYFATWEEKRTDVNIAVQIMDDAYRNLCDQFILVSGDSDLVPPLLRVKQRFPEKRIVVYVPARDEKRGAAYEIRGAANKDATLPLLLLRHCQFPPKIPDGSGGYIEKPPEW